jgi:hypothetical protein
MTVVSLSYHDLEGEGVSLATVIMISSLLKDSSDGFVAIPIQMIEEITNKVHNLFTIE